MKIKNLTASYKNQQIYDNVSVDFNQVGMTFIKGDSGCGKTTLLNILYGLKSFEGEYIVEGEVKEFIRNNISYIFQDFKVDPLLTVYENIVLQLQVKDIEVDESLINEFLKKFDMFNNKHKLTKVLSGGERQRLAIIRALVTKPSILLCDEPTGNLDEDTSLGIFDILKEISKEKLIIVVSHSEKLIDTYSDVTYEIQEKKLIKIKTKEQSKLTIQKQSYGTITHKNLVAKSLKNFKQRYLKIISIFLVFSILSSLYLVLGFATNDNRDFLIDKYSDYESKDTIYVKFDGLKSINYFKDFKEKYHFDEYIIVNYSNIDQLTYTKVVKRNWMFSYPNFSITPTFMNDDTLYQNRKKMLEHVAEVLKYNLEGTPILYPFDYPIASIATVVEDFKFMENDLLYGRVPQNDFEVIINENLMLAIIDKYNELLLESDTNAEEIIYESLSEEDIFKFLEDNKITYRAFYPSRPEFDRQAIHNIKAKVVGVVSDSNYVFDNTTLNRETNFSKNSSNSIVYASVEHSIIMTKLQSQFIIDKHFDKSLGVNTLDPNIVVNDNDIDFYNLNLYDVITMYKKDINIFEYVDLIDKIEADEDVREVKATEMFRNYLHDIEKFDRVDSQIKNYSIFIMLIAFLTAFVPYFLMVRKRKDEFFMYKILGMDEKQNHLLYMMEMAITILVVSLLTIIFFFIVKFLLSDLLLNLLNNLIYLNTLENLEFQFNLMPIVNILFVFIPFVLSYKFIILKER